MGRGATGNRNARHAAIVVAAVLPLVALVTGLTASVSPSRAFAASTTLTVLDGDVAVLHADGSLERGLDAQPLRAGDLVRTAVGARAVLTYFDGSTVELEPESELVVETVRGTPAGDVIIVMRQSLGRSWHVVTHLLTAGSRYEVETPAATAAVRGTAFQVAVSLDGATTVTTTEGVVRTTSTEGTVDVKPGTTTHVTPGGAPTPTVPAPEPKRVVTVTLPSSDQAIVVDAYGRVVGVENGKAVRHVPGATITRAGELLVIRMPDAPNGTLATHVKSGTPDVAMTVQVTEAGATVQQSQDLEPLASGGATGGVEIRAAGGVPQVDAVSVEEVLPKVSAAIADATATTTAPSSSTTSSGTSSTSSSVLGGAVLDANASSHGRPDHSSSKRGGDGAKSSRAVDQGARRAKGATEEGVSVASQGDASPGKSLDRANARAAKGDATAKGNDKKAGGAPDGASATAVEGGPGKSAKTANAASPDDVSPSANGASSGAVAAADEPGQPAKGQAKSPASTDDAAQRGKGSAKGPSVGGDVASNAPATTPAADPGHSSKGAAKAPSAPAATDAQTSASPVASADAAKASASSASAADTSAKPSPSASASAPSDSVTSAPSAPPASDQQKRAPAASADSTKAPAPAAATDTSTKSSSSAGSAAPAVGETSKAASRAAAVPSGSKGTGAPAKAADLGTSTKGDTSAAAGPKKK